MEKYTNIDYLEYELDMYNLKDSQRRKKQEEVIGRLKDQHMRTQKEEIFEEDDEDKGTSSKFNEMRETKTGFGAKMQGGGNYAAEGGLQPDDDESDGEEDEEIDDGIDQDDDEDEESDHNF